MRYVHYGSLLCFLWESFTRFCSVGVSLNANSVRQIELVKQSNGLWKQCHLTFLPYSRCLSVSNCVCMGAEEIAPHVNVSVNPLFLVSLSLVIVCTMATQRRRRAWTLLLACGLYVLLLVIVLYREHSTGSWLGRICPRTTYYLGIITTVITKKCPYCKFVSKVTHGR